jgi:glutamate-1-semialdehyde 2,1-aminomutase
MSRQKSSELFARALRRIPGGVNSPVRAFRAVGGEPPFIARGHGARMTDADGHDYVDWIGSWGPLILGHAHAEVAAALRDAVGRGWTFGAPTELEVQLAERLCGALPSLEMVRLTCSGTEATMAALRVARAFTKRAGVVKIDGSYHGHADFLLVKAGSGAATFGVPDSAGVPETFARETYTVPWNDLGAVDRVLAEHPGGIAAVIVEPVCGNMGVVPPAPGYLAGLRERTAKDGALLVFDEVMTGFRVHRGSAQGLYGVRPDLTCLGKVVGGGLPLAAYGGRADVMKLVAPSGPAYQAGTLAGNPLAVTAGLATLDVLLREGTFEALEALGARIQAALEKAAAAEGVPLVVNRVGSMWTAFFQAGPVTDWTTASRSDTKRFGAFHAAMLDGGAYLPPSQYEAWFGSLAHSDADVAQTESAITAAMKAATRASS